MRKSYSFKRLGRKVQRLAAIMLVALMAVGSAFAEEVTFVFSEQGYENAQVITAGDINDVISFTCAKNAANNGPAYYNTSIPPALRFYAHKNSGDGNSMTLVPQSGYEITGLTIIATGSSNAPTVGLVVDGGALQTFEAEGTLYSFTGLHATSSLTFSNAIVGTNTQLRVLSLIVTYSEAAAPAVEAPVFSIPTGNYYTEQTISLTCPTPGANIYCSINGSDPVLYNGPFTLNATATVSAYATLGEEVSSTVSATYTFPVFVNNIAAYYAAENADLFKITGDVTFVYRTGRYVYVKDATGGLLIYDNYNPVITNEYHSGDVIPGGIVGTRSMYHGLDELVPTMNTAEALAGEPVAPMVVTVAEVLANPSNYISQLVMFVDGEFAVGSFNTNNATNVNFTQDGNTIVVRNAFKTVDKSFAEATPGSLIGFVTTYDNTVQLYPRYNSDIVTTTLPFTCSFDEVQAGQLWTIVNGENTNKWYIGQAQGFDNNKLYISSSNGVTNKYNVSEASISHAYIPVSLPASDVLLTFDLRSMGDANDVVQVSVMDEAPVAGTLPSNSIAEFYEVDEFTTETVLITSENAGEKFLVFSWINNNNGGVQTPAAIDNVSLNTTCTQVSNIVATIDGQTAVVTWTAPEGQNAWTFEYKNVNDDAWQTVNATSTSVTLNNLATEAAYDVRVKANCDANNASVWVTSEFYVPCIQLTSSPLEITIGTGTSTSSTTPMNAYYKNSWTQMVYPASEFPTPGYINSLSWYVNTANTHNYNTLKIYLGTKSSAINESTTDWLPMEDLTLVYESTNGTVGSTVGWETFTLSTPYYYNGEDNLVVVTSRTADAYKSLNYRYTSVTNSVLYRRSDSSPENYASHPGTASGTRAVNLPNMQVDFLGYVCDDAHCAVPADLTVSNVTTTGATLNWEAGDATAWVLSCKAEGADEWTTVNLTENHFELTGLQQNTTYNVRVMSDCGAIGMSNEAEVDFTTVANCIAPQNIVVEVVAHTANVSWLPVAGINEYEAVVTGIDDNTNFTLNVHNGSQFDLTGLVEGAQYNVKVRAICGENETSDWTEVEFTMPTICPAPLGLAATEIGQNNATITWNAGNASSWTVEYGPAGFTLGNGTQVSAGENHITLTGLNPYSYYDVYVMGDCGLGYQSIWSSKLNFQTECGPITITQENPWYDDFEAYSGSGNLAFDNCWATPEMSSYNSPFIYRNYSTAAHSGKNSVELKGDNGAVSTLVLPAYTNNLSELQFSYYGMVTGTTPGTMQLGYITDAADASTFVEVLQVPAQSGSYNRANSLLYGPFTFGENVPDGARITLRFTSATGSCSWNLDDFTVEMKPDCQVPTMLTVSDITATTVTLGWTAGGAEEAWNIEYGPVGFEHGAGTVVAANTNPFTVTGLADATSFEFYVQANCGTTVSEYSLSATATTECLPMATPYEENFDSYSGSSYSAAGVIPNCWVSYTANTNKNYAPHVNTGANSAFNYAQSGKGLGFYANSSGSNAFAILPTFEHPLNTMTVSFWRRMESATQGVLTVGYVTDVNDPVNSYTVVATIPSVTTSDNDYSVNFSEFEGEFPAGARIAFRWFKESTWYTCAIDNVSITSTADATCLPVTNLTADNITYNSAVLTWTPGADQTAWTVAYKATADAEWTTVQTNEPTVTLTGLAAVTEYEVSVTSVCGDATSDPATATFTTICGNPCEYTFVLHDSYGDGWNGNAINVVFSNGTSQTLTLTNNFDGTFLVTIPEGETMTCNWTTGSYAYETSFEIVNDCGVNAYTGSGAQSQGFFTAECPDLSSCPKPSLVSVSDITINSALVSWTPAGTETSWIVKFKAESASEWQTATVSTTTYPLIGLEPNTAYTVQVFADCGDEQSNPSEASFITFFSGCEFTFNLQDSYGDGWNGNAIELVFSNGTTQSLTISSGYSATHNVTVPEGSVMVCNWTQGNYSNETSFTIVDADGNTVYSGSNTQTNGFFVSMCQQITCPAPLALTASDVENGASTITWIPMGDETSWQITLTPEEGDAITAVVTTPTYTITGMQPGDAYTVAVKALCGDDDESTEVTTTVVCPALVDIALVNVYTNPSNCDLSNMIARITVKNVMESPITSFEAYYQVNGEGPVVHETVWPYLSFEYGETYTYTFTTSPTFTAATNVITAWVVIPSETNTDDNTATSGVTYLTAEQAIPYVETFPASSVNNWAVIDNNADNSTFAVTGNALVYNGSDENVGNDVAVSPCVEYAPGTYLISFDYKANSPFYNEKVSLYYGPSTNLYNDYLVETLNFNNADYQRYNYVGAMYMSMDNIHVAFKAESPVGTDGFSIDNVSIKKAVSFSVGNDGNGSITVSNVATTNSGLYFVGEGEEVTLHITSNFGYHVAGIYVNGVLVRGENPNNAIADNFTYAPENGDYVYVTFTENVYNVNAVVTNMYYTNYNDNAPGAIYTPNHETVAHGGSHTGVFTVLPHFHFVGVLVNGMDYTEFVTPLGNNQYTMTLSPVMEDKDIKVYVDLDSTTIIYTVEGGEGTINNEFVVDASTTLPAVYTTTLPGYADLLSTIIPAPGFHVASIVIDGVQHTNIDTFAFMHLFGTHTVVVTFAPNHYVITTTAYGNGTVTPGAEFDYDPEYTYTFTATPAAGHQIGTIMRNNVELTVTDPAAAYTETLTNILDNYNYEVMFIPNTYTITATCGNNGMISPSGVSSYLYHQDVEYVITANPGYYIASVTYDGNTYDFTQDLAPTTFTVPFLSIEENHTISATFAQYIFTVTVNAGANGAIAPATSTFAYGATPTFAITPDAGYSIVDVTVDGASVGAVSTYTFTALDADHTIAATFAANTYTIAATAGNGGTITPAGNTTVAYNANQTYTISASAGYHVSNVFVDGASVGAVTSYTFTGVTANHTIYAAFDANEYTVTVNQPAHGTITPGTMTVLYGATPSFVITPAPGYNVTAITVNGSNVSLTNIPNVNGIYTYTFAAINANQTITATMTAKTYTITASAGANGSITPNGNTTVNFGGSQAYTITPAAGYVVNSVTVDNVNMGAITSYVFTNVAANHTINATFAPAECEAPSFLYTTHIDDASAILHWSHPSATTFDIQYKTLSGNLTTVNNVSGNSYQLNGLTSATTYMWQVRANCVGNNHSEWASMVSFNTDATTIDGTGIEDLVKNNIKVYAEHQNVHILNNEGMNIENVRIFDAYGKLIYSGAVNTSHEVINLNVAAGAYIVNVTTDEGVANYKVTILK